MTVCTYTGYPLIGNPPAPKNLKRHRQIQAIYIVGALFAAETVCLICEPSKNFALPLGRFVQRNRKFFSLLSRKQNDFYFSCVYALAAIECGRQALANCADRTKVFSSSGSAILAPQYDDLFNFSFRVFLANCLAANQSNSARFINQIFSTLAEFPPFERIDELPFDRIEMISRLVSLTKQDQPEKAEDAFVACENALSSIRPIVFQKTASIFFVDNIPAHPDIISWYENDNYPYKDFLRFRPIVSERQFLDYGKQWLEYETYYPFS